MTKTATTTAARAVPAPAIPAGLPTVNVEAWLATQGKNVEALAAAGKILVDAAQLVARRQAEMAQGHVQTFQAEVKGLFDGRTPLPANPQLPLEKAQAAFATAKAQAEELQGIVVGAQKEAFEIVRARLLANFEDVRALAA